MIDEFGSFMKNKNVELGELLLMNPEKHIDGVNSYF